MNIKEMFDTLPVNNFEVGLPHFDELEQVIEGAIPPELTFEKTKFKQFNLISPSLGSLGYFELSRRADVTILRLHPVPFSQNRDVKIKYRAQVIKKFINNLKSNPVWEQFDISY